MYVCVYIYGKSWEVKEWTLLKSVEPEPCYSAHMHNYMGTSASASAVSVCLGVQSGLRC